MRVTTSLSNRIFLSCTLLAALSLGFAFYFVNARASQEAEAELARGLRDASTLVDQFRASQTDTFTRMARLLAEVPYLKAGVGTADAPTVQPLANDFLQQINADVLIISAPNGRVLASAGTEAQLPVDAEDPHSLREIATFVPHDRGILQVVSVPIFLLVPEEKELLGRLNVGFFLDDARAAQFKALTGSDIAFGAGGRILASTVSPANRIALTRALISSDITRVQLGDDEFLVLARPIHSAASSAASAASDPVVLVLRSRTERLRFLNTLRAGLGGAMLVTVILATLLSYGLARTVTRPVTAVTDAMRDVAATGDLTRKVVLRSRAWDDEDARVLATAFNTLTESIGRFQREAAQKERLSSLGRLSTVIAHEIRNPLMIIRATLSTLMRDDVTSSEIREAAADIDEETKRLNRIVTEVLDFARPIRFELAETRLNDVCRASAVAAWEGKPDDAVKFDLDPDLPPVVTDGERLRTALVNILANARTAVARHAPADPRRAARGGSATAVAAEHAVVVKTRRHGDRIAITVSDRGTGIAPEDMAHIFDPYFTTRRAGTGLGLPIAKNIVEGLGGSIAVSSRAAEGTDIVIELPIAPTGVAA
jgi:signal transduction histidine kinase